MQIHSLKVSNNFGGALQSLALSKYLSGLGHENTVYDRTTLQHFFVSNLAILLSSLGVKKFSESKKESIIARRLRSEFFQHVKKTSYVDKKLLIWGSDQIWREQYKDLHMPFKFPDKTIIYAASTGSSLSALSNVRKEKLIKVCKQTRFVSVRESALVNDLRKYDIKAYHVCDPTLLLDPAKYLEIFNIKHAEYSKKTLFYELDSNRACECGLRINKHEDTLKDFIQKFYDCDKVVTDSYHGVLFSIIFDKCVRIRINTSRGAERFHSIQNFMRQEKNGFYRADRKKLAEHVAYSKLLLKKEINENTLL